ncbi:MAG TPA: hypothetical protein PKW98_11655 [Candidatus Wallbacteria bacterium]|nr:hypothetical protein [Candidatus Wallbacteria bacterium]
MRKFHLKKFSIFFIFVFMIAIIFSFILKISSFAEPRRPIEDIDVDRLIKASDNSGGKVRIDVKPRPNPGGADGAPGAAADEVVRVGAVANRIPGDSIVSDAPARGNPLVGSTVKVRVKQGFSFGNGNIRNASLVWKTSSGVVSRPINLQVQAGSINNFNGAFYEFRPSDAGMHQIHFEIIYKIMGDGTVHNAVSSAESFNFVSGVADPGVIPGGPGGPGGPVSDEVVFVPPPPGQDTPPNTVSQKIKINFSRESGGPEIKEREEYVWKWPHELPDHPRSRPAKAHNYAVRAIIRGAELESEDEQGIDGAQHGALDERERNNYVEYGGRYYRKSGIDIDGDGPLPDSLKANWNVRYPSVTPNGSGGWNVAHNLSKTTYEGDQFRYAMPEPSEPFKVIVGMKVKHKWRDFFYDKAPSQISAAIQYYNALKNNTDPTGAIRPGDRYKDISTTFNAPSASGGEGTEGPLEVSVTISGTIKFKEWKKVGEEDDPDAQPGPDGRRPKRDKYEWVGPITQGRIQSFKAGTVKHNDEDNKFTDESIVHELVLDTTAPKI